VDFGGVNRCYIALLNLADRRAYARRGLPCSSQPFPDKGKTARVVKKISRPPFLRDCGNTRRLLLDGSWRIGRWEHGWNANGKNPA
jgi:hypothetical protein